MSLATAQLTVARRYGFASWVALKTEVERRRILDARDVDGLRALLDAAARTGLAAYAALV